MENEKRLIDANALLAGICKDCGNGCDLDEDDSCCILATEIMKAPTVDAVEVVRCKDCRFYEEAESSLIGKAMCCTGQGDVRIQKQANDFCSYGERREGE